MPEVYSVKHSEAQISGCPRSTMNSGFLGSLLIREKRKSKNRVNVSLSPYCARVSPNKNISFEWDSNKATSLSILKPRFSKELSKWI